MVRLPLLLLLLPLLLLAGCAVNRDISLPAGYKPPDQETVYIAPFIATLVPDIIAEPVFNEFVDNLNRKRTIPNIKFFAIIKDELKDIDQTWLAKQAYISGELWSYIESSGCCATEIRMKARINLHQPGQQGTVEIFVPKEAFFEHDRSAIEAEREKFARELAADLADKMLRVLSPVR